MPNRSNGKCPIWEVECEVSKCRYGSDIIWRVENSFRAGGTYEIDSGGRYDTQNLKDDERARLTSILVEQWMKGINVPRLTTADVQRAKESGMLPVHERADRLLRFLARWTRSIGDILEFADPDRRTFEGTLLEIGFPSAYRYLSALAWSESVDGSELDFLTSYLDSQGWITKGSEILDDEGYGIWRTNRGLYGCRVEVSGYRRIEELVTNTDSSQCFVAMWFDPSMDEAYEKGMRLAIEEDSGYSASRIDRQEFIGKIDDEIIAEIRRSRFLVADFTHRVADIREGKCHESEEGHKNLGARGGVYYEAGFAHGLGLPVIFTCRSDMVDNLHFDTRQFNHIVWETPDDLREKLTNRIGSVLGDGPNITR